jgi:hypothetical protein
MITVMLMLSTMLVWVVWVDPGSEVVVKCEGEWKDNAEG